MIIACAHVCLPPFASPVRMRQNMNMHALFTLRYENNARSWRNPARARPCTRVLLFAFMVAHSMTVVRGHRCTHTHTNTQNMFGADVKIRQSHRKRARVRIRWAAQELFAPCLEQRWCVGVGWLWWPHNRYHWTYCAGFVGWGAGSLSFARAKSSTTTTIWKNVRTINIDDDAIRNATRCDDWTYSRRRHFVHVYMFCVWQFARPDD